MQTLTAGSFLQLESSEKTDSLRFTAAQLAENSCQMIHQTVTLDAAQHLADRLWEKAEYVTKEAEKPQLKQIFVGSFLEKFCELKPDTAAVAGVENEIISESPVNQNEPQSFAAPGAVNSFASDETEIASDNEISPEQNHGDEFLGLVKDENSEVIETQADLSLSDEVVNQTIVAPSNGENQTSETVAPLQSEQTKIATEVSPPALHAPSESLTAPTAVKSESDKPASAPSPENAKLAASASTVAASVGKNVAAEPFEFDKCTINVSFQLLPAVAANDAETRTMLVSVVSHGNPPEIEMTRLPSGASVNEISDVVSRVLLKFKNGLPQKYIESLRRQKAKPTAKTNRATSGSTTALASQTQPVAKQTQITAVALAAEQTKQSETTGNASQTTAPAGAAAISKKKENQNDIQGSLF